MTEVPGVHLHLFLCFSFQVEGLLKVVFGAWVGFLFALRAGEEGFYVMIPFLMGDLHVVVSFFFISSRPK